MCLFAYSYTSRQGGVRNYKNSIEVLNWVAFCGLPYNPKRECSLCAVIVDQLLEQARIRLYNAGGAVPYYVWCAQNGKAATLKQKRETIKSFLTK